MPYATPTVDADAQARRRPRVIDHLGGDERAVGDDDGDLVARDDVRRAKPDVFDRAERAADAHEVAVTNGLLEQQNEAADEVLRDVLQTEADADGEHGRRREERVEAEAHRVDRADEPDRRSRRSGRSSRPRTGRPAPAPRARRERYARPRPRARSEELLRRTDGREDGRRAASDGRRAPSVRDGQRLRQVEASVRVEARVVEVPGIDRVRIAERGLSRDLGRPGRSGRSCRARRQGD